METKVRSVKETLPAEVVRNDVSAVTVEHKRKDDGRVGVIKEEFTDDTVKLNRVRERAYQIWAESGFPDGAAVDHWLQAEQEITASISG